MQQESKYLLFIEIVRPEAKTRKFEVYNKEYHELLGTIKWYGAWRKYAFITKKPTSPNSEFAFEQTCLQDIANFLGELMNERKQLKNQTA